MVYSFTIFFFYGRIVLSELVFTEKIMKKRPIAFFIAALVAGATILSGCSCSGDSTLSFNSIKATAETLSYNVRYVEDYNESTKKNAELDKYFTFFYSVGNYTTELKEANKSDEEIKNSDILSIKDAKGDPLVTTVYSLTTDFEIDLKVTINGTEYPLTEKITTKAYIASHGASLAPLYAQEDATYSVISVGTDKTEIAIVKSVSETFYNKDEYRTERKVKYFNIDETVDSGDVEAQETTTKYTFRSAIDNAELLFAIRGLKIEEKASETINAVSSGYESPQPLKITNTAAAEKQFTLNYNGESFTETIKYASMSFALDKTNASGASQYASVQTEGAENIKNTCLLLEYVKPLIAYGGAFMSMGALVFTLNSVVTE